MRRSAARSYGYAAYAAALVSILYLVPFMADLLPHSVDRGPRTDPVSAVAVDLALLLAFAFQHSVMARLGFKQWSEPWLDPPVERSTYVWASCAVLWLLYLGWHPLPYTIFELHHPVARGLAWALFALGFGLMFASSFVVDHWDLFGVKQVRRYAEGEPYDPPELKERAFYSIVRHPLYLGWIIFFWSTPRMTAGHLLVSVFMTAYILVAIPLEERDLAATLGNAYRHYRERVPKLLPFTRPGRAGRVGAAERARNV